MAIRLQGGFTSRKEESVYVFNIHDSSYSGTVIPFDLAADGIVEEYNPEDKGRNQAILTSSMEVTMLVTSDVETFKDDVVNAAEGRFILEVLKDGNKYWYGYILADQFTLQDVPNSIGRRLKIRATDGISRLKKIDYNNAGTAYTGKATFMSHLFNVLGNISLQSFYGSTEDYLTTYVDWWDQNHTYAATSDPFTLTRFDHRALVSIDGSGEAVYSNAYDVLEQLVKAWHCKFFFSEGTYKLVQVNSYETNGATKVLKVYDKNQGVTTTSTSDLGIWNKSTGDLSKFQDGTYDCYHNEGNFKYYPALRETQVEYEHFATENLIPGETWTQNTSQTATYNDIDFNNGEAQLIFNALLETKVTFADPTTFQIIAFLFQIQIRVGSYYLRRNYTFNNGKYIYQSAEWTTTPSSVFFFSEYMNTVDTHKYKPVDVPPSPPMPEGGQLDVTIIRFGAFNTNGQQVTSGFTAEYSFTNVSVQIFVEGNIQDQTNIKVYNATNDDGSTNSEKITVPLLFGDGPSLNALGAMEIYDGSNWVASTGWRVGNSGSYVEFGQLLANEILSGQKFATERYLGTVTGDYIAHGRLRRFAGVTITNYVFVGGRHNLHKDRWTGEWYIADVDRTGLSIETPRRFNGSPSLKGTIRSIPRTLPDINDILNQGIDQPIVPADTTEPSPVQIGIDGPLDGDTEIDAIPVDPIPTDGYVLEGDVVQIQTPTGEVVDVVVTTDAEAGDTSISVVPVTPGIDIPNGSILVIPEIDLFAYIQTSRRKQLRFNDVLRVSDAIVDGDAIWFFRIDENSKLYQRRATQMELQVYTPGSGGGQYSCLFKHDGSTVSTLTVSENTELARATFNYSLVNGLYTFHISSITGTTPVGVNIWLDYIEPLNPIVFIATDSTINGEYPTDSEAFADGVGVDDLYNMSLGNYHGMPYGLVIRNYTTTSYPSDSAAPVAVDEWYAVSTGNVYGAKVGAIRSKSYTGTKYADDTAASGGGVAVGEWYVLSAANPWGVAEGFVKLRKS